MRYFTIRYNVISESKQAWDSPISSFYMDTFILASRVKLVQSVFLGRGLLLGLSGEA